MKNNNYNITRANAKSIANQLTQVVNGLGQSKLQAKKEGDLKGQNGHAKSDKVHSRKSMDNFRSVAKNYFQYIKDTVGGRIEKSINAETAKDFVLHKLALGEIKGSTANTYLSILEKVAEGLEKMTDKKYISQTEFKEMKSEIKEVYDLRKEHINRAYENPSAIQAEMEKFSEYALSSQLQIELGLRIDDAINSEKWSLNDDGTMTVSSSKNGITYQTAPLSEALQKAVTEAKNSGYQVSETSYSNDLKEAVANAGETWERKSSHGLRYNFAQDRMQSLLKAGKSFYEAKAQVSLELGHSRLSITDIYIKF